MIINGTHFHSETNPEAAAALETARQNGTRVRLFLGDIKTGIAWAEENDVLGTISRSMGPKMRVPILLANSRSSGGHAILANCIVAIATAPGVFSYRHPQFSVGEWSTGPAGMEGYAEAAFHNGAVHARFKKPGAAARYVAFMKGERFAK